MTPKKMRSKPYGRPKNSKGTNNGDQSTNFDAPRYENSKSRFPSGNRNYQQLFDKYTNLAREALNGGDRIAAEFHYQYADHYLRLMNERQNLRTTPDQFIKHESNNEIMSENVDIISESHQSMAQA